MKKRTKSVTMPLLWQTPTVAVLLICTFWPHRISKSPWSRCVLSSRKECTVMSPTMGHLHQDLERNPGSNKRKEIAMGFCNGTTGVIHQVAGNGRSCTYLVPPANDNPPVCPKRPFQYKTCNTTERRSSQLPDPNVHGRFGKTKKKILYQRPNINPVAGHGPHQINTTGDLNPSGCQTRPFQFENSTTTERKSIRLPERVLPVLSLYYRRTKINPVAGDSPSNTKLPIWFVLP